METFSLCTIRRPWRLAAVRDSANTLSVRFAADTVHFLHHHAHRSNTHSATFLTFSIPCAFANLPRFCYFEWQQSLADLAALHCTAPPTQVRLGNWPRARAVQCSRRGVCGSDAQNWRMLPVVSVVFWRRRCRHWHCDCRDSSQCGRCVRFVLMAESTCRQREFQIFVVEFFIVENGMNNEFTCVAENPEEFEIDYRRTNQARTW